MDASSGYSQYSNIITPQFGQQLIARSYCSLVTPDITTTDYAGDLVKQGAQITFFKEPEVEIFSYEKGANLKSQDLESSATTMSVDRALYYNVRLDRIDEKQISFIDTWVNSFLKRATYNIQRIIDPEVLMRMSVEAAPTNKGNNAGKFSQSQDLGVVGAPIDITAANIVDMLSRLQVVLTETCRWEDGNMFICLPNVARNAFMASDLKPAYLTGMSASPILNGKLPNVIMGFNVYFTDMTPMIHDENTNKNAYYIVAGHNRATGFVQQLEEHEIISRENTFGKYYRGLVVYGHKPFIPDALAVMYASF